MRIEAEPVFPGLVLIGAVGVDLPGADQKPLSGPQMVPVGHAIGIIGHKQPLAGDHVMEQIVIAGLGQSQPIYSPKSGGEALCSRMLYICDHSGDSPLHLVGHLCLFLDELGMERFALFPAVLEEAEVEKVVIGKHGKGIL